MPNVKQTFCYGLSMFMQFSVNQTIFPIYSDGKKLSVVTPLSLSMVILNSRDWYKIGWLPEILPCKDHFY